MTKNKQTLRAFIVKHGQTGDVCLPVFTWGLLRYGELQLSNKLWRVVILIINSYDKSHRIVCWLIGGLFKGADPKLYKPRTI